MFITTWYVHIMIYIIYDMHLHFVHFNSALHTSHVRIVPASFTRDGRRPISSPRPASLLAFSWRFLSVLFDPGMMIVCIIVYIKKYDGDKNVILQESLDVFISFRGLFFLLLLLSPAIVLLRVCECIKVARFVGRSWRGLLIREPKQETQSPKRVIHDQKETLILKLNTG